MSGAGQLEQFVLLAKGTRGRATADLVVKATAAPDVFVFAELLDVPSVQELQGGEQAAAYKMLQLFAYGTLLQVQSSCPGQQFSEQQLNKLRQLTVVSLAGETKTIPYATLMHQIGLTNIRQLEDFVIGECIYTGIIKGKLDQHKQCLHVHDAISRDIRRADLSPVLQRLHNWQHQSVNVLRALEDRIQWTQAATAHANSQQAAVEVRMEEVRKTMKGVEVGDAGILEAEPDIADLMEHDRGTGARSKRRR